MCGCILNICLMWSPETYLSTTRFMCSANKNHGLLKCNLLDKQLFMHLLRKFMHLLRSIRKMSCPGQVDELYFEWAGSPFNSFMISDYILYSTYPQVYRYKIQFRYHSIHKLTLPFMFSGRLILMPYLKQHWSPHKFRLDSGKTYISFSDSFRERKSSL